MHSADLCCCTFFQSYQLKIKPVLSSIHAPPNIKHFVDGVLPDDIVSSFGNVKKI